ncbi:MAG TPA: membrane dipeptidase [Clostridia bacterium]|nr:membrane dipeptidase [Clostridia bacterium]
MQTYKIADMHCDTVVCRVARSEGKVSLRQNEGHLDLLRLKNAGVIAQCFALFIPSGEDEKELNGLSPYDFFHMACGFYQKEIEQNVDLVRPALNYADVEKNAAAGKISSILTIEDGLLLEGKIERVDEVYEKGVRLITLTWNTENSLGFPNRPDGPDTVHGLKEFGFLAMERMSELGIIVDVSHLSDAGFYDVAKHCKKPFVASHSNARAVWGAQRNLTDDMLKTLGDCGGMTGLNFASYFLGEEKVTTAEALLSHAKHIMNVAGEDALGFGSDFDGIGCELKFGGCEGYGSILGLFEKHFTPRQMEKLTHRNFLRILKECC